MENGRNMYTKYFAKKNIADNRGPKSKNAVEKT